METNENNSPAEAAALWQDYIKTRSQECRNRLVEHYLPLVKLVAGRLAMNLPQHIDKDDLLSSGFFGLLDAIERYDMQRKNKFETYASVRIRGAMIDYLRSRDWLPVVVRQRIRKYEQVVSKLEDELGRAATEQEIAASMEITVAELRTILAHLGASTMSPLDEFLTSELAESTEREPESVVERRDMQDTLAKAIDKLPEKERMVVSLYYYDGLTLKEIGLVLKVTEARISQLHSRAVLRLRGHLARMKSSLI